MTKRHRIQFPPADVRELCQDEVYFYLLEADSKEKIRLHDYERIFDIPGLYEQVVYERYRRRLRRKRSPRRWTHPGR